MEHKRRSAIARRDETKKPPAVERSRRVRVNRARIRARGLYEHSKSWKPDDDARGHFSEHVRDTRQSGGTSEDSIETVSIDEITTTPSSLVVVSNKEYEHEYE